MTALRQRMLRNALEQFIANTDPDEFDLTPEHEKERAEAIAMADELDALLAA